MSSAAEMSQSEQLKENRLKKKKEEEEQSLGTYRIITKDLSLAYPSQYFWEVINGFYSVDLSQKKLWIPLS